MESLERVDLFTGERPHTWVLSAHADGGTPGAPNGRTIEHPPTRAGVLVSPNPLDLARGDPLLITVSEREGAAQSRVQIFDITDGNGTVQVAFDGVLPDLFREGQGIVAEGYWRDSKFVASEVLAKHDENYMPREVADALKKQGHFKPTSDAGS